MECGNAMLKHGYRIKIFNTINFKKSQHYNPFAYIHSEKDILKLVTTLITNTKGEGKTQFQKFKWSVPVYNEEAPDFPELCKLTEEDEICVSYFEVDKRRISIHVTHPYSEERRQRQSQWAKENGLKATSSLNRREILKRYQLQSSNRD